MRKIIFALTLLAFATPLFASDPFAGTWKLNPDKTKYTTGTAPKSVTLVIEEQGANLLVTATGTNANGSPISVTYSIPIKGGAGTVQSGDFDGITAKQVSDHVRVNSYTKGGNEIRTRRMTVSNDGKSMQSAVAGTGVQGEKVAGVDVYDKQ
jgi:hypothetical protein